ncbi:hypothetical protein M9H77_36414 [Catharanthus roseus]|uniref:Uncharacterized protein n=1 Tax=Catharanthus roseus TaxID=4058 RepID=A0ACB9ZSR5_CATRO|nr:hypothetical protein M9H77_36414 [Catharanthus roseus]
MELNSGPITRAQRKKLKALEDNDMVAYLEVGLKSNLEGSHPTTNGSPPLPTSVGFWTKRLWSAQPTTTERVLPLNVGFMSLRSLKVFHWSVEATKSSIEVLHQGGDLGKVLNEMYMQLKIHIKVVSEQPPIEGKFVLEKTDFPLREFQQEKIERRPGDLPSFEESPQIISEVKESKRDKCLSKNKNEFEEGEPEKENENFVESHEDHEEGQQETGRDDIEESEGVNPLTHETNSIPLDDSLCMRESCKQREENNQGRRHLMEFKGNFESAKRKRPLYCWKVTNKFFFNLTSH